VKLTAKEQYGLRALAELAQCYGSGPVSLREIAQVQGLSLPYLEQVALALRNAGLVISKRGAAGGYALAYPPEEITVGDAIRALDGGIKLLPCVDGRGRISCARTSACSRRDIWVALQSHLEMLLERVTLADLTQGTCEMMGEGNNYGSAGTA